jgi:hypothetical protein
MCTGIFILLTFSHDLGMALYLGGGTKECIKILRIQRVIRLITGLNKKESCRQKFKKNKILTITSLYVLEILCYVKEKGDIKYNYDFHEYNMRSKHDLHTHNRVIHLPFKKVYYIWV